MMLITRNEPLVRSICLDLKKDPAASSEFVVIVWRVSCFICHRCHVRYKLVGKIVLLLLLDI